MALGLWLGLVLVVCTFSLRVNEEFGVEATWNMGLLMGVLVALGFAAPSPWVGLVLAWVGMQVPWVQWAYRGKAHMPFAQPLATIAQQNAVLFGGALYVALAWTGQVLAALPWMAGGIVCWSLGNAVAAGWSRAHGGTLPGRTAVPVQGWIHQEFAESAYVASNHMLAWLCGVGALSAVYLTVVSSPLWIVPLPLLAFGALLARNLSGMAAGGIGIVAFATALWGWPAVLVAGVPVVAVVVGLAARLHFQQLDARVHFWRAILWHVRWPGRGLGYLATYRWRLPVEGLRGGAWDHAHNEYIQALVELGPLPVVCAIGYLVGHSLGLTADPTQAYAYGVLLLTAAHACVYFPLHLPGQAVPCLVAMAALDA